MSLLSADTSAGATKLVVNAVISPGQFVIVGKNTPTAEIHRPTSIVARTITLAKPLAFPQKIKSVVEPFDGGLVPAAWYGVLGNNKEADAEGNTAGLNRLSKDIYATGLYTGLSGIRIDGNIYVNDVIRLERDQTLEGTNPVGTIIRAASSFSGDTTGETAVICGMRDGLPVKYATAGPTGRWFLKGFQVDCMNRPNVSGILLSVQQPESITDVRVSNALGLYGLCLVDSQDGKLTNVEFDGNYCGLRYRGVALVRCYGLNIERNKGPSSFISEAVPDGPPNVSNSFDGVHLEADQETVAMDFRDGSTDIGISNIEYSNFPNGTGLRFDTPLANPGGAARYVISNFRCNQNSQTFKMVDDIQRGKSITSWNTETDRWIDYLTPRILMAGYTKTP